MIKMSSCCSLVRLFAVLFVMMATVFCKSHAIDMRCKFDEEEKPVESGIFEKLCYARDLDIKSATEEITSINGREAGFFDNDNITILRIAEQTLNFIPSGIEKFFPKLEDISIVSSHLKFLNQSDLKPFTHLKEIFVVFNDLESLDGDLFQFNPEVSNIDFSSNKLKFIQADILTPLTKVVHASFADNICVDNFGGELTVKPDLKDLINDFKTKCVPH